MTGDTGRVLLLELRLEGSQPAPHWPPGIMLRPFEPELHAAQVHALFACAYADGPDSVLPLDAWWQELRRDEEYDPALVFLAADAMGRPVGAAQCWTSGFVKDIAVDAAHRGQGIGRALMLSIFAEFHNRGAPTVALKVRSDNPTGAERLYRSLGMIER